MLEEEFMQSIDMSGKAQKKQQPFVDPDLDPVLLVPGVGGSILNAVDQSGRADRVWVRIIGADYEFRTKVWSRFDPSTGKTVSLDKKTRIVVPEDRYGLYAIDVLDPDMAKYICVNGDGTVPAESAKADGLDAVARVGVAANHRGILRSRYVFRILKHWLKAGEPDPYYNPLNDYVIIPTTLELERHSNNEGVQFTVVKGRTGGCRAIKQIRE